MRIPVRTRLLEASEELRLGVLAGLWTALQAVAPYIPSRRASEKLYDVASWRRGSYFTRRTRRERRLLLAWARRQSVQDPWA